MRSPFTANKHSNLPSPQTSRLDAQISRCQQPYPSAHNPNAATSNSSFALLAFHSPRRRQHLHGQACPESCSTLETLARQGAVPYSTNNDNCPKCQTPNPASEIALRNAIKTDKVEKTHNPSQICYMDCVVNSCSPRIRETLILPPKLPIPGLLSSSSSHDPSQWKTSILAPTWVDLHVVLCWSSHDRGRDHLVVALLMSISRWKFNI